MKFSDKIAIIGVRAGQQKVGLLMSEENDRFLRLPAVVEKTGRARASIYRMISEGTFPRQEKIGQRAVAWRLSAIARWMDAPSEYRDEGSAAR